MKTRIPSLFALLLAFVAGAAESAEMPDAFSRWMLAQPVTTTPLPQAETRPRASLALWGEQYAWQFQPDPILQRTPAFEDEVTSAADWPSRLPEVEDDTAFVQFAAGAITIPLPMDWSIAEADHLRHVRLYITPNEMRGESSFTEGVWISYHAARRTYQDDSQLRRLLEIRLADVLPVHVKLEEPKEIQIGGRSAIQQPYHLDNGRDVDATVGDHLLIAADWGIVEVHTRFQSGAHDQQIADMFDAMEIGQPRKYEQTDAQPGVIGTWKAEQARLIVRPGGTIELQHDREQLQQIEQTHLVRPSRRVRGRYQTEGDILQVTWEDGSKLNLRFRSNDRELLLTDHHGRVSQLHRLYE